jgi:hypothetical protein
MPELRIQYKAARVLFGVIIVVLGLGSMAAQRTSHVKHGFSGWELQWQPTRLVNGSPVLIRVRTPAPLATLSGTWLSHDLNFAPEANPLAWYAVAGTSLETPVGVYTLHLSGMSKSGSSVAFEQRIVVNRAHYPKVAVSVDRKFTEPDAAELKQIDEDRTLKHQIFGHTSSEQQWRGDFQEPARAAVSGVFGSSRVYNGKTLSIHEGLDYAVSTGTPVAALNSGTVVLARPMFFEGNCVVIDHGQGLLTLYLHLSKIQVKEGEQISRGGILGLSGGTGRSTGPHLHVAVRWQGIYLDPAILLQVRMP